MHILIQMVAFLLNLNTVERNENPLSYSINFRTDQNGTLNDIPFNSANGKIESNSSITLFEFKRC